VDANGAPLDDAEYELIGAEPGEATAGEAEPGRAVQLRGYPGGRGVPADGNPQQMDVPAGLRTWTDEPGEGDLGAVRGPQWEAARNEVVGKPAGAAAASGDGPNVVVVDPVVPAA
jgi:hypothetical protein